MYTPKSVLFKIKKDLLIWIKMMVQLPITPMVTTKMKTTSEMRSIIS